MIGLGARDSGKLELDRSAVDQDVLLDVANRGTAKVCGPNIPYDERVRDVDADRSAAMSDPAEHAAPVYGGGSAPERSR